MMLRSFFTVLPLVFAAACGNNDNHGDTPKDAPAPQIDAGAPDASCFTDPHTYNEIINACTTAVKVPKTPNLPLLNADGSLPPLP